MHTSGQCIERPYENWPLSALLAGAGHLCDHHQGGCCSACLSFETWLLVGWKCTENFVGITYNFKVVPDAFLKNFKWFGFGPYRDFYYQPSGCRLVQERSWCSRSPFRTKGEAETSPWLGKAKVLMLPWSREGKKTIDTPVKTHTPN